MWEREVEPLFSIFERRIEKEDYQEEVCGEALIEKAPLLLRALAIHWNRTSIAAVLPKKTFLSLSKNRGSQVLIDFW